MNCELVALDTLKVVSALVVFLAIVVFNCSDVLALGSVIVHGGNSTVTLIHILIVDLILFVFFFSIFVLRANFDHFIDIFIRKTAFSTISSIQIIHVPCIDC